MEKIIFETLVCMLIGLVVLGVADVIVYIAEEINEKQKKIRRKWKR